MTTFYSLTTKCDLDLVDREKKVTWGTWSCDIARTHMRADGNGNCSTMPSLKVVNKRLNAYVDKEKIAYGVRNSIKTIYPIEQTNPTFKDKTNVPRPEIPLYRTE
ncbi:hypothetical protein DPMN_189727 [Dreissena polymorpha]|uniref:Uncharacterized protein n=1 Tax=Dreissena polymorpha TaxID=45954 RepID=A0A9D4DVE3_DREPO|nr:hypothetical protein DPMN_189727 [Dreissena polymorpha]